MEEGKPPGLGEGEAKASSGEVGVGQWEIPHPRLGDCLGAPLRNTSQAKPSSYSLSLLTWRGAAVLQNQGPSVANSDRWARPLSAVTLKFDSSSTNEARAPRLPNAAVRESALEDGVTFFSPPPLHRCPVQASC